MEIAANRLAIFLHFPYWTQRNFEQDGIANERKNEALEYVQQAWAERYPDIQICHYVTLRAADRYGARMLWL